MLGLQRPFPVISPRLPWSPGLPYCCHTRHLRHSIPSPVLLAALRWQLIPNGCLLTQPLFQTVSSRNARGNSLRRMAVQQVQPSGPAAPLPKVVVITGPTAVGKTAVGLLLSERTGGEVISADSVQVYRGLDIGSDKLPVAERRGVPHHLLDVRELHQEYSAGDFHDEARAAIDDVLKRGKTPVVVGGTGFYLRLLMEGKPVTSRATPEQEQEIEQMLQQAWQAAAKTAGMSDADLTADQRWEAAVALLAQYGDTETTQRVGAERNNYFRLKRAMHVLRSNPGKSMREVDVGAEAQAVQYDWRTFFLYRHRSVLHGKVEARLQEMVLGGLLDEAASILLKGIQPGSSMPSRAVGYKQAMTWLLQAALDVEECSQLKRDLVDVVRHISSATNRLIRSQMVWFRERDEYRWLNMDELGTEGATQVIQDALTADVHEGQVIPGRGRVPEEEQSTLKTRQLSPHVLDARPQDVQAVLQHVQQELVPRLLSAPATQNILATGRHERIAQRQAAEQHEAAKAARKQQRLESKRKRQSGGTQEDKTH